MWKAGVVVVMCIFYQLMFSFFLFWTVESECLENSLQLIVEKETALRNVPLFEQLGVDQIRSASATLSEEAVPPGTTVLSQGQTSECMYIIREGSFDVFIRGNKGVELKVAQLRAPQFFGELSFLGKSACSATVRAATQCRIWKVDERCFVGVDDAAIHSFLAKQAADYSIGNEQKCTVPHKRTSLVESIDVLLWFYQLAGIMLTMSSPLDYLDGSAVAYSIVSFILNTRPSTDSVSTLTSAASDESSISLDALRNKFAFCFSKDSTTAHHYAATSLYYICWMLIIFILLRRNFWFRVRRVIVSFFKCVLHPLRNMQRVRVYFSYLDERLASTFEVQGAVLLRWLVTCFSAISILMLQGTQCISLPGINEPGGDSRWLYDGRVACFSNEGEISGRWQIAPVFVIVAAIFLPFILVSHMLRIHAIDPDSRSELQAISLAAYSGPYEQGAFHWTVVMYVQLLETILCFVRNDVCRFWERLVMIFCTTYLIDTPFWQGYAVFCCCLVILLLHFTYVRAYNSRVTFLT
jgi:CRP-like cAMP-binding protein